MGFLSDAEGTLLANSWGVVAKSLDDHSCKFFIYLFGKHPDAKAKYFPNLNLDDKPAVTKYGKNVLSAIGDMVGTAKAGDDAKFVEQAKKVKADHDKRGINPPYEALTKAFVTYLSENLGGDFPAGAADAWNKFFDKMNAEFK